MVLETTPRGDEGGSASLETDPAILQAVEEADTEASAEVMSLLHEHVPLALLADLASVQGPASPEILQDEGLPDVAWWEPDQGEGHDEAEAGEQAEAGDQAEAPHEEPDGASNH